MDAGEWSSRHWLAVGILALEELGLDILFWVSKLDAPEGLAFWLLGEKVPNSPTVLPFTISPFLKSRASVSSADNDIPVGVLLTSLILCAWFPY